MKIFLIGFMGCGKSTLGRKLATKLGYDLIDLDHQIEKNTGLTVGDYFSTHGEEAFRKLESETLQAFDYPKNCVIATGGGTPCFFDNIEWMNANGTTIYIEMPPAALAKRLESGIAKRPLLRNLTPEGVLEFIEGKLAEREPFYTKASLVMSGISLTADDIRAEILARN
ncbi:shikimate kinase [Pedobacter cryoconitis]|uniref:Shikimate kinase n=1 Tax=Pedobacter cryoconitis TaxID=188932 RepID=A0A7W9DN94_9SPHI|nr:shikimate kinase [Pedobacter cryoconitis]MBB5624010.1 shikimate kinase [Pedobacter cryoconitis]MBB5647244.1 shikimate kinase [Pedobacter cryoconitis]